MLINVLSDFARAILTKSKNYADVQISSVVNSIDVVRSTVSAISESVGAKADLQEVTSLLSEKASKSSFDSLAAIVARIDENSPEALNSFSEVAATISSGLGEIQSVLGIDSLSNEAIAGIVETEWNSVVGPQV